MHARNRNPGNGYRSNSMGMGMGLAPNSRISPEGSMRGHGFYSTENRNFNRGFGRPKSFQPPPAPPPPPPPPPPPRKGDIFMEAGRLAAEYLVAQGLLPPNVLSAKWQNSKKQVGEFQEADQLQIAAEGRTSALARLGNSVSDGGSRRGRFGVDEFSSNARNQFKGRRRNVAGSNRGGYGSDWGQDYGRGGSFTDRHSRASSDMEGDEGSVSGQHEEQQQLSKDGCNNGLQQNSSPSELGPKSEDAVDSESKLDESQNHDEDMSSKPSSSGAWKDGPIETDEVGEEPSKVSDIEMKDQDSATSYETEKHNVSDNLPIQLSVPEAEVEGDSSGKNGADLLTLSKFAKVPTRIRSSLTSRGPKVDPVTNIQVGSTSDIAVQPEESQVLVESGSLDVSTGATLSDKTPHDNDLNPETSKPQSSQSAEILVELDPEYGTEQNKYGRSQSLPGRAFVRENEQESSQGPVGLRSSSFVVKERVEKRALEVHDNLGGAKKPRQWLPYMVADTDERFQLSNLGEKKESSQEENASAGEQVIIANDHVSSVMNDSLFRKNGSEACIEYVQEKQLFPNSFKICDLNLMDAHENRDNDHGIDYPAVSGIKKEAETVDIDLSMSNSNVSGEDSRRTIDVKEIEIIDLENDSTQEDKTFNNTERKTETEFTPLDGFTNHAQNPNDIPDVQDGYGLMISELLGTDFPSCSTVPGDLNPMHNETDLHNGQAALADDDSIYMALGEIPLTFLRPWEQPTPQEYEKPF